MNTLYQMFEDWLSSIRIIVLVSIRIFI